MSTYENFLYSKAIVEERFGAHAKLAFVTTGFHVYRAGRVAAECGLPADGVAAQDIWYSAPNNYLRESIAVAVYKIRGLM